MMNQRPPMTGQRGSPFDGPVKGGTENFMSNPGGFPTQQFPSHNAMANGPQHMNGISSQQDPARHNPDYYNQQPKQPLPPKVTIIACSQSLNDVIKSFIYNLSMRMRMELQ
ncbi:hypothetical protein ABFA07_009695 [Porites harrisoni]